LPLIIDPEGWNEVQLRAQATRLRDGLAQLHEALSHLPAPMPNPWALEAGLNLISRSIELANSVLEKSGTDKSMLACLANQLHEVGASLSYFMLAARSPPPPPPKVSGKTE
jgi:hypothetical protein